MKDQKEMKEGEKMNFTDGLTSLVNSFQNNRNPLKTNRFETERLSNFELRSLYRTAICNKIIRIKAGYSLTDTIKFHSNEDENFYNNLLADKVKRAVSFMIAFGRGIIVIHQVGDDLSTPLSRVEDAPLLSIFSGDMVTATEVSIDLTNPRYWKPMYYTVRGQAIHWSRVIDFSYIKPVEEESRIYQYGGISEFELIQDQLKNDMIITQASAKIIEKSSTMVYKKDGFNQILSQGKEDKILQFLNATETCRGLYSAALIDQKDDMVEISQSLSNLQEIDMISSRRMAMATGIPVSVFYGENVKGLNSTGDNELKIFQDMIKSFQSDFLLEPINSLMTKLGREKIEFKSNQGQTPLDDVNFESKVIDNAMKLWQMGENHTSYLENKEVGAVDKYEELFKDIISAEDMDS